MMTEKLFYQDSYMKKFIATVQSCERAGQFYKVVLDRTAFFPEGGGQSGDIGFLNEARVFDTHEKEGKIYHYTDAPLETGTELQSEGN